MFERYQPRCPKPGARSVSKPYGDPCVYIANHGGDCIFEDHDAPPDETYKSGRREYKAVIGWQD